MMSSSTIDRYLSNIKKHLQPFSEGTTRPAKCSLRKKIPFGKSYKKHEEPGWLSTDTVAHCGSNLRGDFLYTLNSTDVYTWWTETITVINKSSVHIKEGHKKYFHDFLFLFLVWRGKFDRIGRGGTRNDCRLIFDHFADIFKWCTTGKFWENSIFRKKIL